MPQLISGDCHVIEPPSTWTDRMPAGFRAQAPGVVRVPATQGLGAESAGEADWWYIGDKPVMPVFVLPPASRISQGHARDLPMEGTVGSMSGTLGTDDYSGADYLADLARD